MAHLRSHSAVSLPEERPREIVHNDSAQPLRTVSQSHIQSTPMLKSHGRTNSAGTAVRQNSLLSKPFIRPQVGFGHALTTEQAAKASKEPTKPYAMPRTSWTPHHSVHRTSFGAIRGLPEPSTCGTIRSRKVSGDSDGTTVKSIRSAGSSFDIDIYGQMQLGGGSARPAMAVHETEMDVAADAQLQSRGVDQARTLDGDIGNILYPGHDSPRHVLNLPKRPHATRIPTLRFSDTPLVGLEAFGKVSTGTYLGLPGLVPRPGPLQARKVSDYKYPRPAPLPPKGLQQGRSSAQGLRATHIMQGDDAEMLEGAEGLAEEDISLMLEGEESFLAGSGQR